MKNEFKISALLLFLIVFISCKKPKPKIYRLDDLTYSNLNHAGHSHENSKKEEYFVISSPPEIQKEQWNYIWAFCDTSITVRDKMYNQFIRNFYKESRYTPIDYKENLSDYFNIDRIEDHSVDMILSIEWRKGIPFECIFLENGDITLISKICDNKPCKFKN